jgi:hypothetical protein
MQQVREKFQQVRDLLRRVPDLFCRGTRPSLLRRAVILLNNRQGFAVAEKPCFPSVFVQTKANTSSQSLNLSKIKGKNTLLLAGFRLIFAAKTAFRRRSHAFSRIKIFRQNPFFTKYFSKKTTSGAIADKTDESGGRQSLVRRASPRVLPDSPPSVFSGARLPPKFSLPQKKKAQRLHGRGVGLRGIDTSGSGRRPPCGRGAGRPAGISDDGPPPTYGR